MARNNYTLTLANCSQLLKRSLQSACAIKGISLREYVLMTLYDALEKELAPFSMLSHFPVEARAELVAMMSRARQEMSARNRMAVSVRWAKRQAAKDGSGPS